MTVYLQGIEGRAAYDSERIRFYEWPGPACEIIDKRCASHVTIDNLEDAIALHESLEAFIAGYRDSEED